MSGNKIGQAWHEYLARLPEEKRVELALRGREHPDNCFLCGARAIVGIFCEKDWDLWAEFLDERGLLAVQYKSDLEARRRRQHGREHEAQEADRQRDAG